VGRVALGGLGSGSVVGTDEREREEHVMATTGRMKRRLIGMLQKRIGEARLDEVPDSRDRRGRR
jgi:hypothetical protein